MRNLIVVIVSLFIFVSCNAQAKKEEQKKEIVKEKIKPKVNYKVNKEYDEEGNLIRLDSTYTYYYSNIDKDAMIKDSIFEKFNTYFNRMEHPFGNSFFAEFFQEGVFTNDKFFTEDFFRQDFKRNHEMMNKMMQRMDSIKNKFFIEEFPLNKKDKKEKKE
jgi:hypothetical protein